MATHDVLRPAIPPKGYAALRRGRVSETGRVYLITVITWNRQRLFTHDAAAHPAITCFEDARLLASNRMLAWVLMPDHTHWLLELGHGTDLSQSVSRIKSASARHVNARLGTRGQPVWERGFHDRAMRSEENLEAAADYLVANPVRAGLVGRVEDYPYWNCVWR